MNEPTPARPAPEDSRVEKLARYLGESGWSPTASRTKATVKIRDMEYAKLLVLDPSSEALVERISWVIYETAETVGQVESGEIARAVFAALAAPGGEPT